MKDDMMQMIKERLLSELIDKMSSGDDRMRPKGLGVEVQAPDKAHLAEGLDKAKDILGKAPGDEAPEQDSDDDEARMLALLSKDDDDDEDKF